MELYSFFNSSTSYRVRIALALKGLSYDYNGINLRGGEQNEAAFKEFNPGQGVPVLVREGGERLSQSMAIIQYLDETYPGVQLIPSDSDLRWRVLELSNLIACDMHPLNNVRVLKYLNQTLSVSEEQKTQWYNHWIELGFEAVEELLARYGSGACCFGDEPTLADCCLIPQVANAKRMGCDLSAFKRINAIYDHCIELDAFKAADPKAQKDYIG